MFPSIIQKLRNLNSVLYRPDSQYVKAPVHINKGYCLHFQKDYLRKSHQLWIFKVQAVMIAEQIQGYRLGQVLQEGLGLVMDSQDQLKKRIS